MGAVAVRPVDAPSYTPHVKLPGRIGSPPSEPRSNGKAERFVQTCKREWAYARPCAHSQDRMAALHVFLCFYNCHRPHWGIGRKTPQLRLTELVNNVHGCYS